MTSIPSRRVSTADSGGWLESYGRVIAKIACPAYCCTREGAVSHSNRSARRLWGRTPSSDEEGQWDGFAALYQADGTSLAKSASPAALAAQAGAEPQSTELVAESVDGHRRVLVIHAQPVEGADGAVAGVLCSVTDTSERHGLAREVQRERDSRETFLRTLAHELRNPLSSVMTAACLLQRQQGAPDIARMARVIERQTRQLARFIGDLLEASRVEHACDIPVEMRTSSVGKVLELAHDVVDGILSGRGQRLRTETTAEDAVLWCDPERLAQALGNALLNASEFSDDGAEILLTVAIDGLFLEMLVTDHGIGVEANALGAMFEPFRKFAAHPARMPSGAGLGLAIARSVCRAHGGTVSARSEGRGQGTRLTFILPVVGVAAP